MMSSALPPITAIICTYRRPEMLRRAIRSVQSQTFGDFQICIYDNASGDETGAVVAELAQRDSRIKYHCRPENIGALANYVEAMKDVKTPFFAFVADDDLMLPNFYEAAMQAFAEQPEAMFFAGSFLCLTLEGNRHGGVAYDAEVLMPPAGVFKFIESDMYPCLHGTMLRREVLDNCGEMGQVNLWTDRDWLCRIAACYPVITSPVECSIFTIHNLDKGRQVKIDQAWQEQESIAESLKPLLDEAANRRLEQTFHRVIRDNTYFMGIELLYSGDFAGARRGAKKIREEYGTFWQPLTLNFLAGLLSTFPFIRKFLGSVRDLRPYLKKQSDQPLVLPYDTLMDIYNQRKY
jgi:glycosyltransferase involved in cell wall biosynthesis